MSERIDLTMDCEDAQVLAEFWKLALGYEDEPPPAPFTTREEWVASYGEDPGEPRDGAWLRDPGGVGPRLTFLRVPEPKVVKNRLHIDVRMSREGSSEDWWQRVTAKAEALVAAGGSILHRVDPHHIVMADPEGNELCIG